MFVVALSGAETSTTGLLVAGETAPVVGTRQAVVDSDGFVVGVIEIACVEVAALRDVPLTHAIAE
ncbi:hypothetical protein [Rhodococcoides kyotonense]|uniref:hypothetical protein n=1 Tax=Rhodococcoides kyotonense TaxID=398843 RepID=UPI001C3CDCD5|nr:hypothetical protein [Rhodococcus kyotonensis]